MLSFSTSPDLARDLALAWSRRHFGAQRLEVTHSERYRSGHRLWLSVGQVFAAGGGFPAISTVQDVAVFVELGCVDFLCRDLADESRQLDLWTKKRTLPRKRCRGRSRQARVVHTLGQQLDLFTSRPAAHVRVPPAVRGEAPDPRVPRRPGLHWRGAWLRGLDRRSEQLAALHESGWAVVYVPKARSYFVQSRDGQLVHQADGSGWSRIASARAAALALADRRAVVDWSSHSISFRVY